MVAGTCGKKTIAGQSCSDSTLTARSRHQTLRLEYERQYREREQAKADRFNRAQQKRYEAWLAKRNKARQNDSPSV